MKVKGVIGINIEEYIQASRLDDVKVKMEEHNLAWDNLYEIYLDYTNKVSDLYSAGYLLNEKLKKSPKAHIVHYRTKDPIHLLDKVVRKKEEKDIRKDNYLKEITDLIGIRVLHLYKEDWTEINDFIKSHWDLQEPPTANIRDGDDKAIYEEKECNIKPHPAGYRSVHYLLKTKPFSEEYIAEVQVRTIFEEAWSEVDHDIRYPVHVDNPLINAYLMNFNRLAGNADEMSTYLKNLKAHMEEEVRQRNLELKEKDDEIKNLKREVEKLEINKQDREKITGIIDNIDHFKVKDNEKVIFNDSKVPSSERVVSNIEFFPEGLSIDTELFRNQKNDGITGLKR